MSNLLDASSLMLLIKKAEVQEAVKGLQEAAVLDLTFYEVGNIIWKECTLAKFLTMKESERLGKLTQEVIGKLVQIGAKSASFLKILEIARSEDLSFYDSSYIQSAKENHLTLITEDERLKERARKYVKVADVQTLLS